MTDPARLKRIHRVRTLQLGLVQADEARALERLAGEETLAARIGQLVEAVAPTPASADAAALLAAAHFRERLHLSAAGADERLRIARVAATRAAGLTRLARQDRTAVEKLIERAEADAAVAAHRVGDDAPPRRSFRHDPC